MSHAYIRRPAAAILLTALLAVAPGPGGLRADEGSAPIRVPPPTSTRPGRDAAGPPLAASGWWLGPVGLAAVLATCGAVCLAARKARPAGPTAALRVVGRMSLSPRHSIVLVEAGPRTLMIGLGPQAAPALLGELPPDAVPPAPLAPIYPPRVGLDVRLGDDEMIRSAPRRLASLALAMLALLLPEAAPADDRAAGNLIGSGSGMFRDMEPTKPPTPAEAPRTSPLPDGRDAPRSLAGMPLYSLVWLAPLGVMGALMLTAFVRINIVLVLLRQALGSPQVPGNQVLTALALLLTALVMRPVGERLYERAIVPYTSGRATAQEAWAAGSEPMKTFMVNQIIKTNHQDYLWTLYRYASPPGSGRAEPEYGHEFPLRVVAPAFLLSELTTALVMGFVLYLPFLVVDLVVSAVLAAMGLYMLPPTLVAMPLKLIVFVLADGWMQVAAMLLSSFAVSAA